MNIAITGSNGNLGSVLSQSFQHSKYNIHIIPSQFYRPSPQVKEIETFLKNNKISTLIHCAGYTNVDAAQSNREEAYNSNVLLTKLLQEISIKLEIKFVFISSTGVYGSRSYSDDGLNAETDETKPLNYYHETKLEAEKIVTSLSSESLILRVGWLFGSASNSGKDFVLARVQEMANLSTHDEYYSNEEQIGSPTSSNFVFKSLEQMLAVNASGVINCVNEGPVSRFDFVHEIKEACGFKFNLIPKPNSFFSRDVEVPSNETGDVSILKNYVKTSHWSHYLVEYCKELRNNSWRLA